MTCARRESVDEFRARDAWLRSWNGDRESWRERGPADIAFAMEALGVTPDLFARVLALVGEVSTGYVPAGVAADGYRFGVGYGDRTSGELLGTCGGVAVIAWTVSR